jgi:hypothetical protein
MSLANCSAIAIGLFGIYCGLKNKRGFNDVDAPLSKAERSRPNRSATRFDRGLLISVGLLMVLLGVMGRFS